MRVRTRVVRTYLVAWGILSGTAPRGSAKLCSVCWLFVLRHVRVYCPASTPTPSAILRHHHHDHMIQIEERA